MIPIARTTPTTIPTIAPTVKVGPFALKEEISSTF
jgi:hypothetical protein